MKTTLKVMGIALLVVLSLAEASRAEEQINLTMTCTIPIIPGLNAPLIEEKQAEKENNSSISDEISDMQKEQTKSYPTDIIQEEKKVTTRLANGQSAIKSLETIYYR